MRAFRNSQSTPTLAYLEYVYFWLMLRFRENFRLCLEIE